MPADKVCLNGSSDAAALAGGLASPDTVLKKNLFKKEYGKAMGIARESGVGLEDG